VLSVVVLETGPFGGSWSQNKIVFQHFKTGRLLRCHSIKNLFLIWVL